MTDITLTIGDAVYTCAPQPSAAPTFDVTPYSQNDPKWREQVYAGGFTFGKAGCLVCCVAMIVSLAYPERIEPPEVAYRLREAGAFTGGLLNHPARIPQAFERLAWGGVEHWRDKPADISALDREIEANGATICEVKWNPSGPMPYEGNQHFVIAGGWVGGQLIIVDPWDGERKALDESRYRLSGWTTARTLYGLRMVRVRQ